MHLQRSGVGLVVVVAALVGACDGRDHGIDPDGGRVKKDAAAGALPDVDAISSPDAAGVGFDGGAGAAGAAGGAVPDAGPDLPACIAAGACCVDADCPGSCQLCGPDHACVAAKRIDDPTGRCSGTCDAAGQCKSKQGQRCTTATSDGCLGAAPCVDGYCCDGPCAGSCMACDVAGAEGNCTAVPSGPPHGVHTQCAGAGTTCGGACGGRADGACVYPTTKCGASTCSGSDKVIGQGTCGGGICNMPEPETCGSSFACVTGACRTTCAANTDCQPGFTCSKGACFKALKVVGGQVHSCVLLSDHTVRCWGENVANQLGRAGNASFVPVVVGGLTGVKDIAAGTGHTCVVIEGGTVRCWGDNSFGQFGNATVGGNSATPTAVNGLGGVTAIFGGADATCAVVTGGALKCWGNLPFPGNGASGTGNTPIQVSGLVGVTAVAVTTSHLCALQASEVWCWGENTLGQAGQPVDPGMPRVTSPSKVGLAATALAVSDDGSCAIGTDSNVRCWGMAINGNTPSASPTVVPGTGGSIDLGLGYRSACTLLSTGYVKCWGANDKSQLGIDPATAIGLVAPGAAVGGIAGAVQLGTGRDHSCAVTGDGLVRCWGVNIQGQCGVAPSAFVFPAFPVSAW